MGLQVQRVETRSERRSGERGVVWTMKFLRDLRSSASPRFHRTRISEVEDPGWQFARFSDLRISETFAAD